MMSKEGAACTDAEGDSSEQQNASARMFKHIPCLWRGRALACIARQRTSEKRTYKSTCCRVMAGRAGVHALEEALGLEKRTPPARTEAAARRCEYGWSKAGKLTCNWRLRHGFAAAYIVS